ncbi:MAG: sigma-70 family RNA polymerase sigma factor [Spirochaetales bacterium]|jgi:RNA polymerase sigma factor (sigma-70 family)|nr:sigma-70 family RNA polymerase sigma factor [Spirochaetales bacterium]
MEPEKDGPERETAFSGIVRQYYGKILSYCGYFLGGNRPAAEDCAQDIFVILYNRMDTLNNYEKIGGWLYKTAGNLVKQYAAAIQKERKRLKSLTGFSDEGEFSHPLPESLRYEEDFDCLDDEETEEKIHAALEYVMGRLKKGEHTIWRIVFRERRPIADLAAELNLSPGAAKSRVARLRHKIMGLVRRFFEE